MRNVTIGIATFGGRESFLEKTLVSLRNQEFNGTIEILVYDNEKEELDLTDNGKFRWVSERTGYYLSCDDDIIYPRTYVKDMCDAIDRTGRIVTLHGRNLVGSGRSYYSGHNVYRCLGHVQEDLMIDVAGTGVCGFHLDYFKPSEIWKSSDLKIGDLVFSLEAAKQRKEIIVLKHDANYLTYQDDLPLSQTIAGQIKSEARQIEIANEIWELNVWRRRIEIGVSDFRYDKNSFLIEPVKYYFDRLPVDSKKLNVAVSNYTGSVDMYYLTDVEIQTHGLPYWARGCNSVGNMHPSIVNLFNGKNIPLSEIRHDRVDVIQPIEIIETYNITTVESLKIDTEGHDCVILNAWLDQSGILPKTIIFENNVLSNPEDVKRLLERLSILGYKYHQEQFNAICIL
jgi:hypothetical protein